MNSRSFHAQEPSAGVSENTWYTPKHIIEKLGSFDLDPCSNFARPFTFAKKTIEHDMGEDGFNLKWEGRVFCNPPYGKETGKWLEKMCSHGNGIAIVFNRLDTKWAQEQVKKADAVILLKGRISFIRKNGEKASTAACGSILLAYGKSNVDFLKNFEGILYET
jgi:hypothetical protein